MSIFNTLRSSASGLSAQRLRLDTISNNLANTNTTRTDQGGPYRKQNVVFAPLFDQQMSQTLGISQSHAQHFGAAPLGEAGGVQVVGIVDDTREGRKVYEPGHPDADASGYVEYPNVNVVAEMTDMISATRSYEANVTAIQAVKAMALKALEIGRA